MFSNAHTRRDTYTNKANEYGKTILYDYMIMHTIYCTNKYNERCVKEMRYMVTKARKHDK